MKNIKLGNKPFLTPRVVVAAIEVAVGVGIGVYLWYHLALLFAPPFLVLETPERDIITEETMLPLEGHTLKESHVFVNGSKVPVSKEGAFSDKLVLQEGMNIIEIKSVNKFEKETVLVRRVIKQ